jgi:hypothetical protein
MTLEIRVQTLRVAIDALKQGPAENRAENPTEIFGGAAMNVL